MPSDKPARVAERRRRRNAPLRSKAKTQVNRAREFIAADDLQAAESAVKDATIALDKAAQKGAIHPNNAARRKARVMKRLAQTRTQQDEQS